MAVRSKQIDFSPLNRLQQQVYETEVNKGRMSANTIAGLGNMVSSGIEKEQNQRALERNAVLNQISQYSKDATTEWSIKEYNQLLDDFATKMGEQKGLGTAIFGASVSPELKAEMTNRMNLLSQKVDNRQKSIKFTENIADFQRKIGQPTTFNKDLYEDVLESGVDPTTLINAETGHPFLAPVVNDEIIQQDFINAYKQLADDPRVDVVEETDTKGERIQGTNRMNVNEYEYLKAKEGHTLEDIYLEIIAGNVVNDPFGLSKREYIESKYSDPNFKGNSKVPSYEQKMLESFPNGFGQKVVTGQKQVSIPDRSSSNGYGKGDYKTVKKDAEGTYSLAAFTIPIENELTYKTQSGEEKTELVKGKVFAVDDKRGVAKISIPAGSVLQQVNDLRFRLEAIRSKENKTEADIQAIEDINNKIRQTYSDPEKSQIVEVPLDDVAQDLKIKLGKMGLYLQGANLDAAIERNVKGISSKKDTGINW